VSALAQALFGQTITLTEFPRRKDITGVGISDWHGYARLLARKFSYINTHLHKPPHLDITSIPGGMQNRFDFAICSDVLEHVAPPVSAAFSGLAQLLKPGGRVILSVPYICDAETVEHFPDLFRYRLISDGEHRSLRNTTQDGLEQTFRDLVFHGGGGQTLEMRLFGELGLHRELRSAGFADIRVHGESIPEIGVFWPAPWSLVVTARLVRPQDEAR
jgi:SAM-dependent methyltransferase